MFLLDYPKPLNLLSAIAIPSFPLVSSTSMLLGGWQRGIARSPPSVTLLGKAGFALGPRSRREYALQLQEG